MSIVYKKICKNSNCKKEIISNNARVKFCSVPCRNIYHRNNKKNLRKIKTFGGVDSFYPTKKRSRNSYVSVRIFA
jgi:hypothetical protein